MWGLEGGRVRSRLTDGVAANHPSADAPFGHD